MLVVLIITTSIFYFYTSSIIKDQTVASLDDFSNTLITKVDSKLEPLNQITNRLILSYPQINEQFESYRSSSDKPIEQFYINQSLQELLLAIGGSPFNYYQISIYQPDGLIAHYGRQTNFEETSSDAFVRTPYLNDALNLKGRRYVSIPHSDEPVGDNVVSVMKSTTNGNETNFTDVVEVTINYEKLVDLIEGLMYAGRDASYKRTIYIYNERNELIYPINSNASDDLQLHYLNNARNDKTINNTIAENPITDEKEMIIINQSDFSNWTYVLVESDDIINKPIIEFQKTTYLYTSTTDCHLYVVFLYDFQACHHTTKKISARNQWLNLGNLENNILNLESPTYTSNELESLGNAYIDMCQRLNESIDQVVDLRTLETESKMLALQAQMNPHFLYNTLTIMTIMCEDANQPTLVNMFNDLTQMLRYITVKSTDMVSMQQEIEHVNQYLRLVKYRFDEDLTYRIDIPDSMNDIQVPRLMLQPFIENSIKYITGIAPPWQIEVQGKHDDNEWTITFTDNGLGFNIVKLKELQAAISSISQNASSSSLTPSGLGIINNYQRMKLFFEDRVIYDLSNLKTGGAKIVIGVCKERIEDG